MILPEVHSFRLYDGNFTGSESSSLYHSPTRLKWLRSGPDTPITFYTDMLLDEVKKANFGTCRIAWILEPAEINSHPYHHVVENLDRFDLVLTHHAEMLKHGEKFVYYPNGMSWIADRDWIHREKTKSVSIIASAKQTAVGHRMRHSVIQSLGHTMDVYGRGYRPVEHKVEALGVYRFSVVIENCSTPWYFTEKLLDCFATYTMPIYWGSPGISKFFDTAGMLVVSSVEEIADLMAYIKRDGESMYEAAMPSIVANHERAKQYKVAEDWIFDNVLVPRGLVHSVDGIGEP